MQSTLNQKVADPHDLFMITPEVLLAPRVEAEKGPSPETISPETISPETISPVLATAAAPLVDTTFRATAVDPAKLRREGGAFGKWVKRAAFVFVLALGSALAAAAWKEHGDTARTMVAEWIPQFNLMASPSESSSSSDNAVQAEPAPAAIQTAAMDQAPAQAPAAQHAVTAAQAPTAALSTDSQQLQAMARDLAAVGQQIEQLRASLEQLKAGQEQIARDIAAKTAEAKAAAVPPAIARPKMAPPPARPHAAAVAPAAPKPRVSSYPTYPTYPAQAAASPPPPSSPSASSPAYPAASAYPPPTAEPPTADDGGPLVRPPMPLR